MRKSKEQIVQEGEFNGHEIHTGEDMGRLIFKFLKMQGILQRGKGRLFRSPGSIKEEERRLAQQPISLASMGFESTRMKVIEGLRAIIEFALTKHDLSRVNGADFGAGATGAMVGDLLAPFIKGEEASWAQIDVNPLAVEENRKRHPGAKIYEGSYHNVAALGLEGRLDIATGLSSLDATQFMDHAVSQIASTLRPGGHFLHVQDVRPGTGAGPRELRSMNIQPPYDAYVQGNTNIQLITGGPEAMYYKAGKKGWLSVGELFRRQMGRAVKHCPDLDLLRNDWVIAEKENSLQMDRMYYLNTLIGGYEEGTTIFRDKVAAVVTVARKKG
ncbi:class I SAM-dependent methyltransferase [Patescibacteria group bacterium]|nr:class I SAM-dependent methyltransferase [Patescibacteria group bacterium]MBU1683518.1 class I SAM-dependent methyltransferase [Patescibacteria group bacterium]MBU1935392.1 class I SAM-dependent methyltransferase [Patescibacteria group bacterium]